MSRRDPFFTEIISALERGSLDANLFERLATELVRERGIPANTVSGGADCGYDFELVFLEGEPGPGLVTTSERTLGNLRRNLQRNALACPRATKKTFLVTSRSLSSRKRQNLYEAAREEGYLLLGVCDQDDVAEHIYRHSQWAFDLLHLTGKPSALSPVPCASRPLLRLPLVGRSDALADLRSAEGDVILVGSPGSGKTAMLAQLADAHQGLFLADAADEDAVANALRELNPARVFVDDAIDPIVTTRRIIRLRMEVNAQYRLVVTAWQRNSQLEQLLGGAGKVLELEPLTRDEIVDVVHVCGIGGPTPLVREIVNQAEGIPGLAVALARAAIESGVAGLFHGDLVGSLMTATIERLLEDPVVGMKAISILGILSLSGDAGLCIDTLAEGLRQPPTEVQALVRRLEPAGVVRPVGDRVAVRPRALRMYLIREVFFSNAPLKHKAWLQAMPDFASSVRELAWASRAGAAVPDLMDLVNESRDVEAARILAASGTGSAQQLLRTRPDLAVSVAREALHTVPETVLPLLFTAAVDDPRALHSSPDHPLRIVQDWVHGGVPGSSDALRRRALAASAVVSWAKLGESPSVVVQVVCDAVTPQYRASETDPGSGMKVTFTHGTLTATEVADLVPLWDSAVPVLAALESLPWPLLLSASHAAAFPALGSGLEPDVASATKELAQHMAGDLAAIGSECPGVLDRLNTLLISIGSDVRFSVSEDYQILFGDVDRSDWKADRERRTGAIDSLVRHWVGDPSGCAHRLAYLKAEAVRVESHMDGGHDLCAKLAADVGDPGKWLSAFLEHGMDPTYMQPFIDRIISEGAQSATEVVRALLGTPANDAAVSAALKSPSVDESVWSEVSDQLEAYCGYIEVFALRDEIPEDNLRRLLRHPSSPVRAATAEGMWQGRDHGAIPDRLMAEWQDAVVECASTAYWLREMLVTHPTLAERWLRRRLELDDWRALVEETNVCAAISIMSEQQRMAVLRDHHDHIDDPELLRRLVGDSVDLYEALLDDESLTRFHGTPLSRPADSTWRSFVLSAREHGVDPREVAAASVFRWGVRAGPESAYLTRLINEYEPWRTDEDSRVAEVAEIAIESLETQQNLARRNERRRDVEGWD